MKKFLAFAVIAAFLITPPLSFARNFVMTDDDLGDIVGESGSVTVTFTDYTIQSTPLKYVFTDGWNYWDTSNGLGPSPYLNNAYWFFYGTPENNPQKHPGSGIFDTIGYFGYAFYFTGDLVDRSGSITLKPLNITSTDPNYPDYFNLTSGDKILKKTFNDLSVDADINMVTDIKVNAIPGNCLEETAIIRYRGDISASISGSLIVTPK